MHKEQEDVMTNWKAVALFMYGDITIPDGFWYTDVRREIRGLTEEQLFWVPNEKALPIIWQVIHVTHRERYHIARYLQGIKGELMPSEFEAVGRDWCSLQQARKLITSVESVLSWVRDVRGESRAFIESLSDADFLAVPEFTEESEGLSVSQWLFITAAHTALHIGRIQLLRALIEDEPERAC
jgi:hypothetical protein